MVFREKRQKGSMPTAEKRGQVWLQFLLQMNDSLETSLSTGVPSPILGSTPVSCSTISCNVWSIKILLIAKISILLPFSSVRGLACQGIQTQYPANLDNDS